MGHIPNSFKKTVFQQNQRGCVASHWQRSWLCCFRGYSVSIRTRVTVKKLLETVHPSVVMQLLYKMCFAENNFEVGEVCLGLDLCIFFFFSLNLWGGDFFVVTVSLISL